MKLMAKKKTDRHTMQGKTVRLRQSMWDALDDLAEYLGSDMTEEIRIAVRERLEKYKRWPWPRPKETHQDSDN